ncbi:MAG: lipopolysaccharide transport periplasmic protein LptA [Geminicoccaceae bacterium]|nr:MAG: lipopolysaccharide transport periplasmic protein LptA [Geminicoccaceae bacterium]
MRLGPLVGAALFALAALQPVAAQSLGGDSDEPIEIEADVLEVRQNEGIATFRGNVDAVQGDMTLTSDVLDVFYAGEGDGEGRIQRIVATGNVVVTSPREIARGQAGIYDLERRTIVLTGDVVLTREGNVLRGSRLEVDLASGVSRLLPARDGGRVRALFLTQGEGGS